MERQKTLHNYTRGKLLYITMEPLGSMLTNPLFLLDFFLSKFILHNYEKGFPQKNFT